MILAVVSCYSQYPITKKINNDSVVIITLEQGNKINEVYKAANSQIAVLKDSITLHRRLLDSLTKEIYPLMKQHEEYKWKYLANRELYIQSEKEFNKLRKIDEFAKFVLAGIIVLLFSQIHH